MIRTLFFYKWKSIIKQPALFFVMLFFPIVLLGSFAYVVLQMVEQESVDKIQVAYVDYDQTFETKTLVNQLQNEEALQKAIAIVDMSEQEAKAQLEQNKVAAIIEVPKGFTGDLRTGTNTPIKVITNGQQPYHSKMVEILLSSGAAYISAAQSGINTVYDLYIRDLETNRSEFLQQLIVQYTLFALDRNDLFSTEEVKAGTTIGWVQHGIISFILTSCLLSAILFQTFGNRQEEHSLLDRLRAMNGTSFSIVISQFFTYMLFLFIQLTVLSALLSLVFDIEWLLTIQTLITWLIASILIASILSVLDSIIASKSSRTGLFTLLMMVGFFISGIWLPLLYLPNWIQELATFIPFHHLYASLKFYILSGEVPFSHWSIIILFIVIGLAAIIVRSWIKEGKDGYLSFSSK
ncbi:ABC-type multidrug transport system permease subunit [Salirhabdus euzebyi]|uniref:ABC-type multidrug transport system permease subunit n=1 Tax=Salirhabdus euzebyi TaxID=394506 RepID=A0A841Q2X5_9BACI|nr:ABC transporter permease [Salirhabdus euzebyi]MBB6451828.1 ABC-type multidrug transport system permease subunit [Salirhabdus euzebyi]